MDETYGTYVDDECFDIHEYDDDTAHDRDDGTDDDTDDGGRGNLYTINVFWAGSIPGWKYWNGPRKNSGG